MDKTQLLDSLKEGGFPDKIVKAFEKVKREDFIPENLSTFAYEDIALPLDKGSTISQPYTVAFMLNLLDPKKGQKILEIGSGSGYVLALLSEITKDGGEIYGIELNKKLVEKSSKLLEKDKKIRVIAKDGSKGLPEKAPFDRILISASASEIPKHLTEQLKDSGIMIVPVQNSIYKIEKQKGKTIAEEFPGFVFVPLRKK